MCMVKISDLRLLEVISIQNGRRLGNIVDIDLDVDAGKVKSLVMPGGVKGWMLFRHREEQLIPWEKVTTIGQDVILVDAAGDWTNFPANPEQTENFFPEEDAF